MAQMSAQSSASVAQAATAVVEGLAQDFTRNHHDSDFMGLSGKHSERKSGSVQTNAAKETPMTTKIERLRMEKEKLLKGLYGDDI